MDRVAGRFKTRNLSSIVGRPAIVFCQAWYSPARLSPKSRLSSEAV